ncbi:MAG: SusC/RagA family TonB-linked outer membrane protein [Bacteroidota bacterium]|nr:SusC/RagA family TonB-linked outer membrane protein [Bacteroidota bacterium]MDP4257408.1 SusC/RagA family TonB-linked outer membrane protein [Bacteroidota bacterium]
MRKSSPYCMLGFLLGAQFFLCAFPANAQSKYSYSPGKQNAPAKRPLLDVLIELNHTKGVYFLFSQQTLGSVLVNTPVIQPDLNIERILDQVLRNTGLNYKKVDESTFVILARRNPGKNPDENATIPIQYPAYDREDSIAAASVRTNIAGKVMAADGRYLQGVSVTLKGTNKGTSTDLGGGFELSAAQKDILIFSFVGFRNKELPAGEAVRNDIVLEPSDQPLTEVLVTAMGIKKQSRSMGYSATELPGSAFTQSREINFGNALIGQVAGVSVAVNGTGPYGSSRVLIRGNASLSGNNQPLYVIDGIPYDNSNQGYSNEWGGADLGDGLSNINPDDIESVLVLKGVAASALYGFRGGNGAILITTKSGSRTRGIGIQVNDNGVLNSVIDERKYQYVYGQGISGVKPLGKDVALESPYYSWGARLDGSQAVNYLGNNYIYAPAKNGFSDFFRTGSTNQLSVALTGGNNKGHFRLAGSTLDLNAIVPNSAMRQQALNFNSTYFVTNRLQMILTADYILEQVNNRASLSDAPGNVIAAPLYLANSFDIRWMKNNTVNPDGTEHLPGNSDPYFENPYYIAYDYQNRTARNRFTGGLTLKDNLLDWLYVQGQVSFDGYIFDATNIVPSGVEYTRSDGLHGGNLTQYTVNYHELNDNIMVGVDRLFGKEVSFNAHLGANRQDNINSVGGIGAVPNSNNRAAGPFIIAGYYNQDNIAVKPYSNFYKHYRVNSVYGSADLGFRNYLFLSLTARNDWFSTLNINTDHYLYPSVSASLVFTEAWHMPAWISSGKLRASLAGSSNGTEPYQNTLTYGLQGYTVSGQQLGYVSTGSLIPNANLRPVSISEKEGGLYMQFLESRLGFDLTYYDKQTTDDIVKITVSPTSGYTQDVQNIGRIRNSGFELLFTANPVKSKSFKWDLSFNFAVNNNKVLYIGGLNSIVIDGAYPRWGSEVSISNVVGMPYGQIMGFAYKRDPRGRYIYSDGLSNPAPAGEPEHAGIIPLGSTVYRQTGGLSNEFHYKDLSLSFLVDFKFGAKIYSGTNLLLYYYGLQSATLQGREGGYIGPGVLENGHPNTFSVPAQQYFQDISATGADHIAEEFVYDASFVKLRSLILAYSFPEKKSKNGVIKGLTISLVGRNLATLVKHTPNIDPESSINNSNGQGLELSGYPAVRSMGLNINMRL